MVGAVGHYLLNITLKFSYFGFFAPKLQFKFLVETHPFVISMPNFCLHNMKLRGQAVLFFRAISPLNLCLCSDLGSGRDCIVLRAQEKSTGGGLLECTVIGRKRFIFILKFCDQLASLFELVQKHDFSISLRVRRGELQRLQGRHRDPALT